MYRSAIRRRASRIACGVATCCTAIGTPLAIRRMISFSSSRRRIAHAQLEHEPVHLRFGQGVRALLFDRVLRGEHQERLVERVRRAPDGHLLFLHRLEQRCLYLGRRAVDLVGKDDVREDRPLLDHELPRALLVHLGAEHVGRQQVGRELDALERRVDRLGERSHREGLGEPGDTLEQDVPARQQADQQAFDHVFLPDDSAGDLVGHVVYEA